MMTPMSLDEFVAYYGRIYPAARRVSPHWPPLGYDYDVEELYNLYVARVEIFNQSCGLADLALATRLFESAPYVHRLAAFLDPEHQYFFDRAMGKVAAGYLVEVCVKTALIPKIDETARIVLNTYPLVDYGGLSDVV